jgi:hypothetical protein
VSPVADPCSAAVHIDAVVRHSLLEAVDAAAQVELNEELAGLACGRPPSAACAISSQVMGRPPTRLSRLAVGPVGVVL